LATKQIVLLGVEASSIDCGVFEVVGVSLAPFSPTKTIEVGATTLAITPALSPLSLTVSGWQALVTALLLESPLYTAYQ
jgi:hypothetical protein